MSKLEIHVLTQQNRDGDYASHALVTANDANPSVRASMFRSGSQAAARIASSHTQTIGNENTSRRMIQQQNRRLITE